jgi:hypothetical protein
VVPLVLGSLLLLPFRIQQMILLLILDGCAHKLVLFFLLKIFFLNV